MIIIIKLFNIFFHIYSIYILKEMASKTRERLTLIFVLNARGW